MDTSFAADKGNNLKDLIKSDDFLLRDDYESQFFIMHTANKSPRGTNFVQSGLGNSTNSAVKRDIFKGFVHSHMA
jgi:hypothetical protein